MGPGCYGWDGNAGRSDGTRPSRRVSYPRDHGHRGQRGDVFGSRGLDRGAGGRVRLGQVDGRPERHGHPAQGRPDRGRRDPVPRSQEYRRHHRHRQARSRRPPDAGDPRRPNLDHFPGAHDLAIAGPYHRRPGRRGLAAAPRCGPRGRPGVDPRDPAAGRLSRSPGRLQRLCLRVVRGSAPARHDRHGAGVPPGAAGRRRADDCTRRHHPGPDSEAADRSSGRAAHGGADHHPRPGRGRQYGRGRGGHVPRPRGRERHLRRHLQPARASLSEGAVHCGAAHQHGAGRAPGPDPSDRAGQGQPDAPKGRGE